MLINRVGGGGENVTEEVNIQTPLVQEIAALALVAPRAGAKYLWAKFDSTGQTLIELITATQPDTYVDGLGDDGYYYQRIVYVVGADDKGTYLLEL